MNVNTTRDFPLEQTGIREIPILTGSGTPKSTITLVAWSVSPGRRYDWGIDADDNVYEVGRHGWRPATMRFLERHWYQCWTNDSQGAYLELFFIVSRTDKMVTIRDGHTGEISRRKVDVYEGIERVYPEGRWRGCPIVRADAPGEAPVAAGGAA